MSEYNIDNSQIFYKEITEIKSTINEQISWVGDPLKSIAIQGISRDYGELINRIDQSQAMGEFFDINVVKESLLEIAARGSLDNILINQAHTSDFGKVRRAMMRIYTNNPALAKAMVVNNIAVGHGSGSSSLLGALTVGLLSMEAAREQRQIIAGGENTGLSSHNWNQISTATWFSIDTLEKYSNTHPINEKLMSSTQFVKTNFYDFFSLCFFA